mmetsp:Transcript_2341/g.8376  ORF Transcript_2341/g.8376 Transcript_2341/m.8376 type:complete len:204 (-) Transcript_2341:330-941(-)
MMAPVVVLYFSAILTSESSCITQCTSLKWVWSQRSQKEEQHGCPVTSFRFQRSRKRRRSSRTAMARQARLTQEQALSSRSPRPALPGRCAYARAHVNRTAKTCASQVRCSCVSSASAACTKSSEPAATLHAASSRFRSRVRRGAPVSAVGAGPGVFALPAIVLPVLLPAASTPGVTSPDSSHTVQSLRGASARLGFPSMRSML